MAPPFPRQGPLVVVKFGGSLLADRAGLQELISEVCRASCRSVIVSGGGKIADGVRAHHATLGISERLAHRLAMQAMADVGEILCELAPQLVIATQRYEIDAAHAAGLIPVWTPARLMQGATGIPENWTMTSDSFAAYLAFELSASALLLLKSASVSTGKTARALSDAGLTDAAFPDFFRPLGMPAHILGPEQHHLLADLLADPFTDRDSRILPETALN